MRHNNYRRYGAGGPKRIREPKWVKKLPENCWEWTPEQEIAYYEWSAIYHRRGYSKDEWSRIHQERRRIKREEFSQLADELSDFNGEDILLVLKKQLEWQADYFENFYHIENGPYYASQMRICCRLIDIICCGGLTGEYRQSLRKRVNMRNASRFSSVPQCNRHFLRGPRQEVRYRKAYSLLFKILFRNVMKWRD